ncbi:hypothetical protein [Borreliella valaisiana]|uniref:hypothetical protein n=1 Tax=Borreliella valaisiana TaxID=62088 RepID=UPI001AEF8930|nr:hypothetical protein [Borreliella valaisiana]
MITNTNLFICIRMFTISLIRYCGAWTFKKKLNIQIFFNLLRYNTKKFLKTPITLFILVLLIISFSFSRSD